MLIRLQPSFAIDGPDGSGHSIDRPLQLLAAVERHGNLRLACADIGASYRSGWDMIATLEQRVGGPVLVMTRGKGSSVTELGRRLLWALKIVHARFDPLLESMAAEIDTQVQLALEKGQAHLKIFASHGYAIAALNSFLQRDHAEVELSYRGSLEALNALGRHSCDVAGFPLPIGALQAPVLERIRPLLKDNYRLVTVATRRLGLMVSKGNPHQVWNMQDLVRDDVRFVNRQQGSGTRMILELLLERSNLHGAQVNGFEDVELTHAAVAAYVASGKADTGIGVEAAARQFGLDFIPLLSERYFLVCEEATLHDARFGVALRYLQSQAFRASLLDHPGYDGNAAGSVAALDEATRQD